MAITTVSVIALSILAYLLSNLPRNFRDARKTGLPYYYCPVSTWSPFWIIFHTIVGYNNLERYLPGWLFDRVKFALPAWEYRAKYTVSEKWGPVFVLVTPGTNVLFVADPDIAKKILVRRNDFGPIEIACKMMAMFGGNVVSAEHDEWKRHRRIIAPALNERIMSAVWDYSSIYGQNMLEDLASDTETTGKRGETNRTLDGMRTITINVLGAVGFGSQTPFAEEGNKRARPGFHTTLMSAVMTVVDNIGPAAVLSAKALMMPFMPQGAKKIGVSKLEFPIHVKDVLDEERRSPSTESTLVASLVALSGPEEDAPPSGTTTRMTSEEITGNLFVFIVGGFHNTATTLSYAILALAVNPELQDWIFAAIDEVDKLHPEADYFVGYPLMSRLLALMYETMRLHTPTPNNPRWTHSTQRVDNIVVPPETQITISWAVIHVAPSIWGKDVLEFRPSRWLDQSNPNPDRPYACEPFLNPPPGPMLAFSTGPRVCPGEKMAKVEFVSAMKRIFSRYKVEIVKNAGETNEAARHRVKALVADSGQSLAMHVNRPKEIVLRWVRR